MHTPSPPHGALKIERVLVLCRAYLGDLLLTGPVFRNLRAALPDARIVAGVYGQALEPLSFYPEIDEVVTIPRRAKDGVLAFMGDWLRTIRKLRAERFDLVYDLTQTDRSAVVTLATGAPRRATFIKDRVLFRHRAYTDLADWRGVLERTHTVDLYLKGLGELGVPISTRSIAVALSPEEEGRAPARLQRLLGPGEGPMVLVHPGASTANRLWPEERFAAVCDALQERFGARVLLLGGPGEAAALGVIRSAMRTPAVVLEERVSVRELAALFRVGDLFLGHDSGPMHLAAAVGTPVTGLFGAALPEQWAPLGEGHRVVRPRIPCETCACPERCRPPNPYKMFCVQRITDEMVLDALGAQIARWAAERSGVKTEAGA